MSGQEIAEAATARLAELRSNGASERELTYAQEAFQSLVSDDATPLEEVAEEYHQLQAQAEEARLRLREFVVAHARSGARISDLNRITGVGRITLTSWASGKTTPGRAKP